MKKIRLLMLLIGTALLAGALYGYQRGSATESWVKTTGEVISYELIQQDEHMRDRRKGPHPDETYYVDLRYRYSANGIEHSSDNYEIDGFGLPNKLQGGYDYLIGEVGVERLYQPGSQIDLYYNPSSPAEAVVVKGYRGSLPLFLGLALAMIGFGAIGLMRR
ncbi:hypothetical protein BOW53_13510 [Solemya pervernicosa gill symbiont]|uniref:DUF3592 domain-containing protein n=2 Tax=Gammaproteobacteria incertae sedis TaxID=118884 RepID=A0A1T2L1S7_9GAMM|nr:DUF3592 domain-containing protein [Candidatus Reidiella endopervernicosa]OOZ38970.1 hypothetical protein BOW53_13510 [Solemya pervernicosa gill symbiont]QKQ26593.1 DUF3592 domain-containing protein [Candidatus Reidiella endopervernicosa]